MEIKLWKRGLNNKWSCLGIYIHGQYYIVIDKDGGNYWYLVGSLDV